MAQWIREQKPGGFPIERAVLGSVASPSCISPAPGAGWSSATGMMWPKGWPALRRTPGSKPRPRPASSADRALRPAAPITGGSTIHNSGAVAALAAVSGLPSVR
jgi:hypothetical protein